MIKVEKEKKSAFVVEDLTEKIQQKYYLPGDSLPSERILSSTMCVSRTVIREALSIMVEQQLIARHDGKYIVCNETDSPILGDDLSKLMGNAETGNELLEIRNVLEIYAVKRATEKIDSEGIRKMEESLREMDDVIFGRIPYKWSYETKFHEAIIKAANNAILEYIYDVCNRMLYAPGKVASRTADGTDLVKARQEHQNVLNDVGVITKLF